MRSIFKFELIDYQNNRSKFAFLEKL